MSDRATIPLPVPRVPVSLRPAAPADLPALDALQKRNSEALGYFPTKQFEEYIATGGVLLAEDEGRNAVGYCVWRDRYLKRDELGVIYQLCVAPGARRKLVGATLVRGAFERSAYGCRLYCCWCAQDIAANHFWENMGFVPIAFRAGSAGKKRVHVFWQRRINEGDAATPYWYPSMTNGGAIREDRLVFPIPPGTHWKDVSAVALPAAERPALEAPGMKKPARATVKPANAPLGGFRFQAEQPAKRGKPKSRGVAANIDPKLRKAARELRDRWLEHVNAGGLVAGAKYDVGRALPQSAEAAGPVHVAPVLLAPPRRMLPAA